MLTKAIVQIQENAKTYTAKILQKLGEKKGADGTVEKIILIAVVLLIGGLIMKFFQAQFPTLLTMIWGKIEALFNTAP